VEIHVKEIEPSNIGAILSFDYDPNGGGKDDPELMSVTGALDGLFHKKELGVYILVVAGREFEFGALERVNMRRSNVLSKLHKFEVNNHYPASGQMRALMPA